MNILVAQQISELVFQYNGLPEKPAADDIASRTYFWLGVQSFGGCEELWGCVGVRKMSWFAYELKHLTVKPEFRGRGYAQLLVNQALSYVAGREKGLVYATIKVDNQPSQQLFGKLGFEREVEFENFQTKQRLNVWRKTLEITHKVAPPEPITT